MCVKFDIFVKPWSRLRNICALITRQKLQGTMKHNVSAGKLTLIFESLIILK